MRILTRYNKWILRQNPGMFISVVSMCMLVTELMTAVVLVEVLKLPSRENINLSMTPVLVVAIILAPPLETVIAQLIPFKFLLLLGIENKWLLFSAMLAAFVGLHISAGLAATVVAGVVGGSFLSYTFLRWSKTSTLTAFYATTCCHLINNLVIVLVIFAANLKKL